MTTGTRRIGDFCWINMLTPHPAGALAFFGELLGWTSSEMPGVGHTVHVGGHAIGGLFDLAGPRTPPGTPPLIGLLVKVESADAAVEKVAALGGRAQPAFDIGPQGRMAVCHDPTGAELDVWEARRLLGTDVDSAHHGAPSWFELMTTDVDLAARFHAGLFGWTVVPPRESPPGLAYTTFEHGGAPVAGMMPIPPAMGQVSPRWVTYFTVDDAAEAERRAVALGGRIERRLHDVPGVGRLCGVASPQGVPFCVIQYGR
jgi:hypothetical protein